MWSSMLSGGMDDVCVGLMNVLIFSTNLLDCVCHFVIYLLICHFEEFRLLDFFFLNDL